ncbi:RNA-guided endonuclease InsQ/TnpB family protein [Metabacillus litoralis]|uniref:RNA-guided endonuclease InsQ/TnpB family protein n=1 Tax=Metabacillus litoralis TaxID=152268 RepID=UPI001CFF0D7C|nr:transposase [Metabacillus litoralis]
MTNYKTMQIWIKKGHRMHDYFQKMCENAKNMHNVTNFYIRQIYTGLTQEKELLPLQIEALANIDNFFPRMNDNQLLAYQKNLTKEKMKPIEKRKEIKCNLFVKPSKEKPYVDYHFLDSLFKVMMQNDYRSLPTQSSQAIMKVVFQNWKSFYASLRDFKTNPSKFKARPRIPGYSRSKEKEVSFSNQDCVIKEDKFLKFPKTKDRLNIGKLGFTNGKLKQVRVNPKYGHYVVEIIFEVPSELEVKPSKNRLMSIDLGIDNIATIVTNTGRRPILVKGENIKAINQQYNKLKAHYTGVLRHGKNPKEGQFTSKRLEKIHNKRFNKIKDLFHKASHQIERIALEEDIDTIVIGQNKDWKQKSNMGKKNNQTFVTIPHSLLIQMITYKLQRHGIQVLITEESYTSKASFLDCDNIPVYSENESKKSFSGKRIKRGIYRSKNGVIINADVNGAANIMRKVFDYAFKEMFSEVESLLRPQVLVLK